MPSSILLRIRPLSTHCPLLLTPQMKWDIPVNTEEAGWITPNFTGPELIHIGLQYERATPHNE